MDERMARLWAGRGLCFAGLAGPVKHTDEQLSSRIRFIGHTGRMTRPVGRGRWFILEGCGGWAVVEWSELHFNIIDMPAAFVAGLQAGTRWPNLNGNAISFLSSILFALQRSVLLLRLIIMCIWMLIWKSWGNAHVNQDKAKWCCYL